MLNTVTRKITCPHCGTYTDVQMHRRLGCNHRCWVCCNCGQDVSHKEIVGDVAGAGYWIPKAYMPSVATADLPTWSPTWQRIHRCAVCGALEAELHHFAPRAFFGTECERWPKAYLCKEHHRAWHDLVTPGLVHRRGDDRTVRFVWICEGCKRPCCRLCEPPASDEPALCDACLAVGLAAGLT